MTKIILSIGGMTCSACSNGLEKYLKKQEGILEVSVNLVMATATIEYDEKKVNLEKLEKYINKAGFTSLGVFKEMQMENKRKNEKYSFAVFSFLALILMYISMGHMIHLPIFSLWDPHQYPLTYTVTLLLLTIPFLVYGFDILKSGYKNLIHKTPNMDTLVTLGTLCSFVYSLYGMYHIIKGNTEYTMHLYFESAALVIYFMKLGRFLEGMSRYKTREAIQKLVEITPKKALMKEGEKTREVTIDEIQKNSIVIAKPGDKIAVDGEIVNGSAHLDESFITGESKPVSKKVGDKVIAGSINYDGYVEYKAEKIGKDSTISEIVRLVVEATNTKAPIAKIADQISGYFVPIVMLISFVTFLVYLGLGLGTEDALITFVTILVVACPCSLGLATPLAIVVSEGRCASLGILVKRSEILEKAEKVDTIVFDKTGTLTYGTLRIAEWVSKEKEKDLFQIVGSLEKNTSHPIAKAFIDTLHEKKIDMLKVENFENIAGYGIRGEVGNKKVIVCNGSFLEKNSLENPYYKEEKTFAANGNSLVYVVIEDMVVALIGVSDVKRVETKEVIKSLKERQIKPIMLTGDHKDTALKIAREMDIEEVIAGVLPKEKAHIIQNLRKDHFVIMCGDGINDSPALATADIGISVKSGTDIARDSADVILIHNDLQGIISFLDISKKTIKIIKQNLFWAFSYNILMIPIAMGVFRFIGITISPMIASLAMVCSSLTVTLNALRLRK